MPKLPRQRAVTLRLPEPRFDELSRIARARGLSLSELLGEAAAVLLFESRLAEARPSVEQCQCDVGAPSGKA